jgi:RuvB-like protein 2
MRRDGTINNRAILIGGKPGTGKTAIAIGMAKSLGVPFAMLAGSETLDKKMSGEIKLRTYRKSVGK